MAHEKWWHKSLKGILALSLVLASVPVPALAEVLDGATDTELSQLSETSGESASPDVDGTTDDDAIADKAVGEALAEVPAGKDENMADEDAAEGDSESIQDIDGASDNMLGAASGQQPEVRGNSATDGEGQGETLPVTDYATFISYLRILEGYASDFVEANGGDANGLVINFIRTGVKRFSTGTWSLVAGPENTDFTAFVTAQDEANGTHASSLKNLGDITLPNGDVADLGHLFGTVDIAYYAKSQGMSDSVVLARFDMGGWAGDITDLMSVASVLGINGTSDDERAAYVSQNYLGVTREDLQAINPDVDHSFEQSDIYGDLDGYYISTRVFEGGSISQIVEDYFTSSLTDVQRADYFLKDRLNGMVTRAGIRKALLDEYSANTLINALEASYAVDTETDIRVACVYSFADYLFELAGDDNGTDPVPDDPTPDEPEPTPTDNPYYSVFSSSSSTLAPGVTQKISHALTADKKQIVYYAATVDVSRDDVQIFANYAENDASRWQMSRVEDQMRAAQAKHEGETFFPVVGINADFYNMSSGEPSGCLVMEGVQYHGIGSGNFFGILKDGTPVIGGKADYDAYKNQLQEAVGTGIYLVRDGEIVAGHSDKYYNNRASRTAIGIDADGKVVMLVLDGRQEPFSAGGAAEELAQLMLDAGCVTAVNLDGGGSTTYVAKLEGADDYGVVNRPSDGYARSVSSSLMVVSTTSSTNEFDHALVTSDADYVTVGSTLNLEAQGVSATGNAANLPDGATWAVSDEAIGTIDDGVFSALAAGEVDVQIQVDGNVVGSKTITVISASDLALSFTKSTMDVVFGETVELPLLATYNGNKVEINSSDVDLTLSNSAAGSFDGFNFTASAGSGLRNTRVTAYVSSDYGISANMTLSFFDKDEAYFDFDNAMFGARTFAWNRDVSNSDLETKVDEGVRHDTYYVVDPSKPMVTDYTFAIDMTSVPIPEQFAPLLSMVAGTDVIENIRCWDVLLQLAERVSALTNVTVTLDVDPNLDVDVSNIKIVNDFFELTDSSYDADAHEVTLKLNFIKRGQAVNPDEANPIVIVSGITLTPTDDASWDADDQIAVTNEGSISYDIYLGAGALYNMSRQESFQQQYGIYPYVEPSNSAHPYGGHFASTFTNFNDSYTLNNAMKQGWFQVGGNMSYFVDNVAQTGIHYVEGIYPEQDKQFYFDLGDDGVSRGKVTGLFELDGDLHYAVDGEPEYGWRIVPDEAGNDNYYYFNRKTGAAVDGTAIIDGHTYVFEDHILVRGAWEDDAQGTHYWWAGTKMQNKWFTAEGKQYFAYANTYEVAKGVKKTLNHERTGEEWYLFDSETGAWLSDYNGLYTQVEDGVEKTYLIKDGVRVSYPGLFQIDGDYYYITSSYVLVKGRQYYVSKTNGLLDAGNYTFDADGKIVFPEELKQGLIWEDGELYYYVDGERTYAGLVEVDGAYYYFSGTRVGVRNRDYTITKTNGLLPAAKYTFDAEGKMVVLDGIVKDGDTWTYYVDGAKTYAGLIEIDGAYYYVKTDCTVVHGQDYTITKTNGLKPQARYTFDDDGKMVLPDETKDGLVWEDGELYYYVDGEPGYAGLVEVDGYFYYFPSSKVAVRGHDYTITKTNGLKAAGKYAFDSEGKMVVLDGIVRDGDTWTYYVDGAKVYAGLIEIDGAYYYVKSDCTVVHGRDYYVSKNNGIVPSGTYTFDAEGKMQQ